MYFWNLKDFSLHLLLPYLPTCEWKDGRTQPSSGARSFWEEDIAEAVLAAFLEAAEKLERKLIQ